MKRFYKIILIFPLMLVVGGWGYNGHKIINNRTIYSFPDEMFQFRIWQQQLEDHASDADDRKSTDPAEGPKHYIDIDNYPEFISSGHIPQSFDSAVAVHGQGFVMDQGILPWAIIAAYDSLIQSFIRRDWSRCIQLAADLGHYVADAHMPLHITRNYNGQYTGQTGIHSRYESSMINRYYNQITYDPDTVLFIQDVQEYVFSFIYYNYLFKDSLLNADLAAKAAAGNTTSDLYYLKLWEFTSGFTTTLFKNASDFLAALIYSSWVNAGRPSMTTDVFEESENLSTFFLNQNYPNPFNPSTNISFSLPQPGFVKITVYSINGNVAAPSINKYCQAGPNTISFNGASLPSGIYIYTINSGHGLLSGKMTLIK